MKTGLWTAAAAVVAGGIIYSAVIGVAQEPVRQAPSPPSQAFQLAPPLVPLEDSWLRWPLAPSEQAFGAIDGRRLRGYVDQLAAISRRSRDRGEQWWGRIQGMPADKETEVWLMQRFRQAGVVEVRAQSFDLPPRSYPKSWSVTATGAGKTMRLESSMPAMGSGTVNGLNLEAAYVGLGTEADFMGRDVKGKAVFILGSSEPGLWSSSAIRDGGLTRAEERGAAAVFIAVESAREHEDARGSGTGEDSCLFNRSRGLGRGTSMIERGGRDQAPHLTINLDASMVSGLKTSMVWAVIPGMTDEKIIVNGHRDGYFEAAADNASGVATLIGLAEYFAKLSKEKRRRTIMLVASPGHHGTPDLGLKWIQDNKTTGLGGNLVLFMNGEHTAAGQTYLRGPVLRKANAPNAFWWSLEGSKKFQAFVLNAFKTFGVATYAEPELGIPPGANGDYGDAATVGLVDAGPFYHTEGETADTIPPWGLEASTRAFAKIIDQANTLDRKDLTKAPAAGTTAQQQ